MSKLTEKRDELRAKQQKVHEVFEKAGEDLDFSNADVLTLTGAKDSAGVVDVMRGWNKEMEHLGKELDGFEELGRIKAAADKHRAEPANAPPHPGAAPPAAEGLKTLGQLITESEPYKRFRSDGTPAGGLMEGYNLERLKAHGQKTLFQTTAGWAPESLRIPGLVIEAVTRPIQVLDIIPTGNTGMAAIVYMEETTRTHGSAERAENAAYAESTFVLTQRSSTVRSIGTSIPVTDEQLEDVEGVQSYLEQRLTFGNRQRFDNQVLNGDGIAPNLTGILNVAGIQTQAKGADPVPDAIYKAMTLVRVTGRAFANAVVLHPNDWRDVRLLRTADGIYIWGAPSERGPEMIWGRQVVQADSIAEGTGLVGDFANFCQMFERRGMEVAVGHVNDDFLDGRKTIRAGFRVAFVVYRATGFCTVTGI